MANNPSLLSFPHPLIAHASGVLAMGGDLSEDRLLLAYHFGIFPWYNPGEPILWWHPDPRCVLFPSKVKVSKSMRPYFNKRKYKVTYNQCFDKVMQACKEINRPGQPGTWISEDFVKSYKALDDRGLVLSTEVWDEEGELVGGLYGVRLAKIFFGESMFSKKSNASKFGFIALCRKLEKEGCLLIDCQIETPHLRSLGAEMIPRDDFLDYLRENRKNAIVQVKG